MGKDAATVSEMIGLSVETWQQGSNTGEQLQLVADPRRLATCEISVTLIQLFSNHRFVPILDLVQIHLESR